MRFGLSFEVQPKPDDQSDKGHPAEGKDGGHYRLEGYPQSENHQKQGKEDLDERLKVFHRQTPFFVPAAESTLPGQC